MEVFPDQATLDKQLAAEGGPGSLALVLIWSFVACVVIFVVYAMIQAVRLQVGANEKPADRP